MQEWTDLQRRVYQWQLRNFGVKYPDGNSPHWTQVAGITEELGELVEAENREAEDDAVCDATVYAMSLAASFSWLFGDLMDEALEISTIPEFVKRSNPRLRGQSVLGPLGKLNRAVLKRDQGIRGYDVDDYYEQVMRRELVQVLAHLFLWMRFHRQPGHRYYLSMMELVVTEVTARDWITNPTDAHIKVHHPDPAINAEVQADIKEAHAINESLGLGDTHNTGEHQVVTDAIEEVHS